MRTLLLVTSIAGMILGISGLVLWPLGSLEGWNSNALVAIMFAASLILLALAAHCVDRLKKTERETMIEKLSAHMNSRP